MAEDALRLEKDFAKAQRACADLSRGLQAPIAQIMVIWASGYLESACRDLVSRYVKRGASPGVANYVVDQLDRFRNPRMERILRLVRLFEPEKAADLAEFSRGAVSTSVNTIVGVRNRLAHGRPEPVTVPEISGHFRAVRGFAHRLDRLLA